MACVVIAWSRWLSSQVPWAAATVVGSVNGDITITLLHPSF